MKKVRLPLGILLVLVLLLSPLIGYGEQAEIEPSAEAVEVPAEAPADEDAGEAAGVPADEPTDVNTGEAAGVPDEGSTEENTGEAAGVPAFSYSDGLDENGLWEGIVALNYVELLGDLAISIPSDTHKISEDDVQVQIDTILGNYVTVEQVTDRPVEDAQTVNIDYVGSIDGVEFDGGSTGGNGTDVTIGVTSYIDDFLEQLIGHMPGETFNVEVTFPEDYGVEALNGKDAVFATTINYIAMTVEPELTDEFVKEKLSAAYGWSTVEEMTKGVRADLQKDAVRGYIQEYFVKNMKFGELPVQLMEYQQNAMLSFYEEYATYYGMDLDTFLSTYMGVSSVDELIETNQEGFAEAVKYYLVTQAVAESAGIAVSDEDVADYFKENYSTDDYSMYAEQYGMPYLKQTVLCALVLDHMEELAVLE